MKTAFFAALFAASLFFGVLDSRAQEYPYYYWDGAQYQQYWPQASDPYYELHVLHYQLYLPQYQPFPVFQPLIQPCCFSTGLLVVRPAAPVRPLSQPPLRPMRRR